MQGRSGSIHEVGEDIGEGNGRRLNNSLKNAAEEPDGLYTSMVTKSDTNENE